MAKKIITFIITIIMVGASVSGVYASSNSSITIDADPVLEASDPGNPLSVHWIDSNLLHKDAASKKRTFATIPKVYSLKGSLPEARLQSGGTCWAHAAIASLESNLITKELASSNIDLSENHLTWFTYNGKNSSTKSAYAGSDTHNSSKPYDAGGNDYYATATLARWYGAANQSIAPSATKLKSSLQTNSQVQLSDVNFLESPKTQTSRNALKEYILHNGAVTISYYHDDDRFKDINGNYTYYYSDSKDPNHEVTIVGWDDTVKTAANITGAWLIRNSYGSDWGDDGYFYLSYYDKSLCDPCSFTASTSLKPYDHIYQYDGAGFGDNLFISTVSMPSANRYTARADELIQSVGTYTISADSKVNVRIYLNPTSTSPVSGTKLVDKTFMVNYAGYHTLELGKTVSIPKGAVFTVVIKTQSPDGYLIPTEIKYTKGSISNLSLDCTSGQSYLYLEGSWTDVTDIEPIEKYYKIGNVLAKAHAISAGSSPQTISAANSITKIDGCSAFNLNARLTAGNGKLYYKSSNTSIASVDSNGKVTVKKPGAATLTIMAAPTTTCKSATKKITLTVKPKKSAIKSVTTSKKKLQVKWYSDSDVSGYKVVIARNSQFTKNVKTSIITSNNTRTKTFTNLSSGKKYYVKVCAYKTINGKKVYGSYSSVKSKTVK